ncbi:MAG: hypothetical protein GY810_17475 [Aureispira sp.]|nr:hypothetical protein [Aureispira sp.]
MNLRHKIIAIALLFTLFSCDEGEVLMLPAQPEPTKLENPSTGGAYCNDIEGIQSSSEYWANNIKGTWIQTGVFNHDGSVGTAHEFYANLRDSLLFQENGVDVNWVETTGFQELDYQPSYLQQGYDAMYRLNSEKELLDIVELYGSLPINRTDGASRCGPYGPPPYSRFKVVVVSPNKMIVESFASGWSVDNIGQNQIPENMRQKFVFEKL